MAAKQRSLTRLGKSLNPFSYFKSGFEYEEGEKVGVETNGEVRPGIIESRRNTVIEILEEGPPEYEVRFTEYEIQSDASVNNDYDINVKATEEKLGIREFSEDDIL